MLRELVALSLIFTGTALAQKPKAPFSDPNDPDDPALRLEYKGELTVPKDGKVLIPFMEPFQREPSCSFDGGTLPAKRAYYIVDKGEVIAVSITAKPKAKLHYHCRGVKRELAH